MPRLPQKGRAEMGALLDLTGRKYPHFQVIERCGTYRVKWWSTPIWLCRCECGKYFEARGDAIRRGTQVSCGCQRAQKARERVPMMQKARWAKREKT